MILGLTFSYSANTEHLIRTRNNKRVEPLTYLALGGVQRTLPGVRGLCPVLYDSMVDRHCAGPGRAYPGRTQWLTSRSSQSEGAETYAEVTVSLCGDTGTA